MMRNALLLLLALGSVGLAPAQEATPPGAEGVDFVQNLGRVVPLDLSFRDAEGKTVTLADCSAGRPAIVALVYYECPMLCTLVLNGLVRALKAVSLEPGRDFEVVVCSIDPDEGPDLAAAKKEGYLKSYGHPDRAGGFHFLVGGEPEIARLADAVGYRFRYDPETDQFAHPSGITFLTADGTISRYLYGVDYQPRDVRLALVDSGEGKVGRLADRALLLCFAYDPTTGKYGFAAMSAIRLGAALLVTALGVFVFRSIRRDAALKEA